MNQILSLQQLTDRLIRVEKEMHDIRRELTDIRHQTQIAAQATVAQAAVRYPWANKGTQRHWISILFRTLSIQAKPIGAEVLQQRMAQAGLAPNELSRSLTEAREE